MFYIFCLFYFLINDKTKFVVVTTFESLCTAFCLGFMLHVISTKVTHSMVNTASLCSVNRLTIIHSMKVRRLFLFFHLSPNSDLPDEIFFCVFICYTAMLYSLCFVGSRYSRWILHNDVLLFLFLIGSKLFLKLRKGTFCAAYILIHLLKQNHFRRINIKSQKNAHAIGERLVIVTAAQTTIRCICLFVYHHNNNYQFTTEVCMSVIVSYCNLNKHLILGHRKDIKQISQLWMEVYVYRA